MILYWHSAKLIALIGRKVMFHILQAIAIIYLAAWAFAGLVSMHLKDDGPDYSEFP